MLDPVEKDFNAFSKAQSYAEDFDEFQISGTFLQVNIFLQGFKF